MRLMTKLADGFASGLVMLLVCVLHPADGGVTQVPSTMPTRTPSSRPVVFPAPEAYWSFDSLKGLTIPDDSGHGHDGTIVRSMKMDGPMMPTLKQGIRGQALRCGGLRQCGYFMSVTKPPQLNGPFTITAWVCPRNAWDVRLFYQKERFYSAHGLDCSFNQGRWKIRTYPNGKGKPAVVRARLSATLNHWSFLAYVWDGRQWRLYLNGLLVGQSEQTETAYRLVQGQVPLNVGGYNIYTNNIFQGLMDEVRIWNQRLTPDQIERVMFHDLGL